MYTVGAHQLTARLSETLHEMNREQQSPIKCTINNFCLGQVSDGMSSHQDHTQCLAEKVHALRHGRGLTRKRAPWRQVHQVAREAYGCNLHPVNHPIWQVCSVTSSPPLYPCSITACILQQARLVPSFLDSCYSPGVTCNPLHRGGALNRDPPRASLKFQPTLDETSIPCKTPTSVQEVTNDFPK